MGDDLHARVVAARLGPRQRFRAFLPHDRPGYWETRGYANGAHPWRNDRGA